MYCIPTDTGNAPEAVNTSLQNERGIILIIVLVMLLLLSVLGSTVLTSSMSDLRIAGNTRNTQEAFFNADGILEHALVNSRILNGAEWTGIVYMSGGLPVEVSDDPVTKTPGASPPGGTQLAKVESAYLGEGKAPRGSGYDDSTLVSYYNVNVVGTGTNATEVAVDAGIVKFH
ncbi:MAG: PilX N-terminal domain-containing pilus assembly protein [Desulfuromonadaceae bacterium]|nr:PilX N-terminal domain-containing pilus assembly protein [Desulfuromonadaceae bacterium]